MLATRVLVLTLVAVGAADVCGGCSTGCPSGNEQCACYPNGTCNVGVTCASDMCLAAGDASNTGGMTTVDSATDMVNAAELSGIRGGAAGTTAVNGAGGASGTITATSSCGAVNSQCSSSSSDACGTCEGRCCCDALTACVNDSSCNALVTCVTACSAHDALCVNRCISYNIGGNTLLTELEDCLNANCSSLCQ